MALVQQVRLAIFSKDDLKEVERDVIQIEKLAQRKVVAEKKIQTNLSKRGGIFAPGQLGSALPKTITKAQEDAENSRKAQSGLFGREKSKDKRSKNAIFEETVNKVDKLEKGLADAKNTISNIENVIDNPVVFFANLLSKNKNIAKIFAAAGIGTLLIAIITAKLKEFFGPGGAGDIRKIIKDEVAIIPDLNLLIEARSGKVFFTADTRVRSEIAQNSASQSLGEKSQLFNLINVGGNLFD